MGDRGNIVIKDGTFPPVYFYTHWGGSEMHRPVQAALKRMPGRWDDGAYLARAIFCELVKGEEMEETGYGISSYPPDNGHPYLVVHVHRRLITRGDEEPSQTWTFADFANADPDTLVEPKTTEDW